MQFNQQPDAVKPSKGAYDGRPLSRRTFSLSVGASMVGAPLVGCGGGSGSGEANTSAKREQALQAVLDKAVTDNQAPYLVGMTASADGITFSGAAGNAATGLKAGGDTVFRIFSMSKAIGSTAAMILIERGQLTMDTVVRNVLPEFAGVQVLDGYDKSAKAKFRAPLREATVRHLATHTSGIEYEFWRPEEAEYLKSTGSPGILGATNLKAALLSDYPMVTDPGTRWGYGPSIDWLTVLAEKVSGQKIMDFLKSNLLDPLGMKDTVAVVRDDMKPRLATVGLRGADGKFGAFPVEPPATSDTFGMGHALYSTPNDYMKFLRMILNKGTLGGKRVLGEAAVAQMLQNQMPNGLTFQPLITASPLSADFNPFPKITKTHGFGFLRVEGDVPGMRRSGSVSWAGVCNSHYWIDPASGMAGVFMTQSLPFVEAPFMAAYESFERAAYQQ